MKLFIPAVGYRIKLTSDWNFSLYLESRNDTLLRLVVKDIQEVIHDNSDRFVGQHWDRGYRYITCSMPAGTVLEVDRVFVKTMNKTATVQDDCDSLTFKVIEHPTFDVKKKIRFWTKLSDVNVIDYELPIDHTAGKDEALAKSKQPKKLTPEKIKREISDGIYAYIYICRTGRTRAVPDWCTPKFVKEGKQLEAEYNRLFTPYEFAKNQAYAAEQKAKLETYIATGTLNVPVSLAGKIGCIADVEKHMPDSGWSTGLIPAKPRGVSWDIIVAYKVMGGYGLRSTTKSQSLTKGGRRRTFFAAKPYDSVHQKGEPDISNFCVIVDTDPTDTKIINVEACIVPEPTI